jgi:putative toxin-antitoxin system antitoxin component (TIGR02293 family)
MAVRHTRVVRDSGVKSRRATPGEYLGFSKSLVEKIKEGFSTKSITAISETLNLSTESTLSVVNLSKQTWMRRQKLGRLTPEESDRVWRINNLIEKASRLLGSEGLASEWLKTPSPALDGATPLQYASTEPGARAVEQLIGRLEHGIPV